MKLKHKIALFIVYLILFGALSSMVDYYAYGMINPWMFVVLSFIGAFWVTIVHVNSRRKRKVDELAEDIEEIL